MYMGAERTGRFSGSGSQPQNLKNSGPDAVECKGCGAWSVLKPGALPACPACGHLNLKAHEWGADSCEAALAYIATGDLDRVEAHWGSAVELAASCMRGLFIAEDGFDLICSDYSAIEAVVLACLAGEQWRIDVFNTHGKIYEASASQASGVPLDEILAHKKKTGKHHPLRKKGKVRELAGGYNGWIGAWKNFGADAYMSDDEIKADVLSWRGESPAIVEMWGGQWRKTPGRWQFTPELYGVEGAVVSALQNPGTMTQYRDIYFHHDTRVDVLYITLPSGRRLAYHQPRLTVGKDQRKLDILQISFMGYNTNALQGPVGWVRRFTYGGRLVENITQAVARDILVHAMLRVEDAGYPIVLHVHDEIVSEILKGFGSIEEYEALMMVRESWFKDWPIKAAGGWRGREFRK
jgi:DNA polymerase